MGTPALPSADETLRRALFFLQTRNPAGAEQLLRQALEQEPRHAPTLGLLTIILMQAGRLDEAEECARRAIAADPKSDSSLSNYGLILQALTRPAEALERFDQALALNGSVAETWHNRGTVLKDLHRHWDAAASFEKATALKPGLAESWLGRANMLGELKEYSEALACGERALQLNPNLAEAWLGRGNIFNDLRKYQDALAAFDTALRLQPHLAEAWLGRGNASMYLKDYAAAAEAYGKALAAKPDLDYASGQRVHALQHLCDWNGLEPAFQHILTAVRKGRLASLPFPLLAMPSTSADQALCAKRFLSIQPAAAVSWSGNRRRSQDRIRLAYLSSDFGDHPVAYSAVGLLEHHDRSRFETTAISLAPRQPSAIGARLEASVDRFVDAGSQTDRQIADTMRDLEIDIAIDLNGLTEGARFGVLLQRPAPIQISYLGYAGTMGSQHFDYLLADRCVIPEHQCANYVENIIYLPETFFAFDSKRPISTHAPTRDEQRLPENAFVFCCFNHSYKLTPQVFDSWARLLRVIDGSVLWLSATNTTAMESLRREAQARGIEPNRLVFAERTPGNDEHLARLKLADLFLDTLPYNAHATASDALWAGVPVLTRIGETFAGRVAASLLNAVQMPELITQSADEYQALALKFASDPHFIHATRAKLDRQRTRAPLFDTARLTQHVEAAYTRVWDLFQRGEQPRTLAVEPIN